MAFRRDFLSVVVPLYNEQENLPELCRRLRKVVEELHFSRSEVLLVSDGSTDRCEAMIRAIVAEDPLFAGIFLTRNFGHQAAVCVGLSHARGTEIAVIDGDLQDPPEAIPLLLHAMENGADVAYGVRTRRKENAFKRFAYSAFYRLLQRLADFDIPLDAGDFSCMNRCVLDAMLALPERNRFVRGLRAWVGYRQVGVEYERAARFAGLPKYTLRKLLGLAYDGLFSFSSIPVRLIQWLGFAASSVALLVALAYVVLYFAVPDRFPSGFATLAVSIWFFGGIQLLFLGVVGEYVVRACDESRRRPVALVREVIVHPEVAASAPSQARPSD